VSSLNEHLKDGVAAASAELPEVSSRRMFGCDAFFANLNIYALIWDGRLVLRLPDPGLFAEAMRADGACPWAPMGGSKGMAHWVCMGEALHDDHDELGAWVERAHRLAMLAPPKKAKTKATKPGDRGTRAPKRLAPKRARR
jgi:TfoX/Sxy family transcriptional regulator of competence genes